MAAIQKIVILGSGNVASHLGHAFQQSGREVLQVYSRRIGHAKELAGRLACGYTNSTDALHPGADAYVMAITDDAIEETAARFPLPGKLLLHTSGTTPMEALREGSSRYGVFYPLQTFSRGVPLDYSKIPICLEAADEADKTAMEELARSISETVQWTDSAQRSMLHVAAVFACNFVNHLYVVSSDILEENQLSFDLLRPLIEETARKALQHHPAGIQTGPARRNNVKVIGKHLEMLKAHPDFHKLYNFISESIRKKHLD